MSRRFQASKGIIFVAILILTSFLVTIIVNAAVDACSESERYRECLKEHGECETFFSTCIREKLNSSCSFENDTYHYPKCFPTCLNEYNEMRDCIKNNQDKYGYTENEAFCRGGPQGGGFSCRVTSSTNVIGFYNTSVSSSNLTGFSFNANSTSTETSQICPLCPAGCELNNQSNIHCGECICPLNYGFCSESGLREVINETLVYCYKGLWQKQKQDNESCLNNFECLNNFCNKNVCYDISLKVKETKSILQTILNYIKNIFHI